MNMILLLSAPIYIFINESIKFKQIKILKQANKFKQTNVVQTIHKPKPCAVNNTIPQKYGIPLGLCLYH